MLLTFDQQKADVPKKLADYPEPLRDDKTLQKMLYHASHEINTTGAETAHILQTPLEDYILFKDSNATVLPF
jgi:hypothetical protein